MTYNLKKNPPNILASELNLCLELLFSRRWKWSENGHDHPMDDTDRLSHKCTCSDDRLLAPVRVDHSAQLVPPLRRATAADDSYNGYGHGGANGQYNGADYSCAVTSRLNVLKVGLS